MADRFVVGDTVTLGNTFKVAGTATDPTDATLTVTKPDLTTLVYAWPDAGDDGTLTRNSAGDFEQNITGDAAGNWLYEWEGTGAAADVQDGAFTVFPSADTTVYCTIDQLKSRFKITDATDDHELQIAIEAASRSIDDHCGRIFYDTGSATAKKFRTDDAYVLRIQDFHTTTGLVVATDTTGDGSFDTTWSSSGTPPDYQVEPLNPQPGWPWNRLVAIDDKTFPVTARLAAVQITARWGWAAVPDPVREAALVLAAEHFKLKDAPFGVAGFGEFGAVRVRDNAIALRLLRPYERISRVG